jgi:hypothetical protein
MNYGSLFFIIKTIAIKILIEVQLKTPKTMEIISDGKTFSSELVIFAILK